MLLKSKILYFETLSCVHVYHIEYLSYWQGLYRICIVAAADRIVPALIITYLKGTGRMRTQHKALTNSISIISDRPEPADDDSWTRERRCGQHNVVDVAVCWVSVQRWEWLPRLLSVVLHGKKVSVPALACQQKLTVEVGPVVIRIILYTVYYARCSAAPHSRLKRGSS